MLLSESAAVPPDHYHAYLLRIWQAGPQGPWRVQMHCVQTGEKRHFVSLEDLFAFLLAQAAPKPNDKPELDAAGSAVQPFTALGCLFEGVVTEESNMNARIFTAQFQAGKLDDAVRLVQEEIQPAAQQQPGFHYLYFLTDPATHKGVIVSLWETAADRSASESSGFLREQLAKLAELVAGPPSVERFTVSSHG